SRAGAYPSQLSGGQKQRVAIARTLATNPKVLLCDEATSALDSVTEAKIQKAFDELAKGRTTLIIAHRLSTVSNADLILFMDSGRITEQGTHSSLISLGGRYASFVSGQLTS
ncbi:MAG: ATP-binding cassette domain-containing protein, partial [Muribaculaceae bacterium]|nr:ATP-binding cassette domain-containing protein [Muribaculaceae bacterium]